MITKLEHKVLGTISWNGKMPPDVKVEHDSDGHFSEMFAECLEGDIPTRPSYTGPQGKLYAAAEALGLADGVTESSSSGMPDFDKEVVY